MTEPQMTAEESTEIWYQAMLARHAAANAAARKKQNWWVLLVWVMGLAVFIATHH